MKIHAPDTTYTGTDTYGAFSVSFEQGVATVAEEDLPAAVRTYMAGAGYGFDEAATLPEQPAPVDPREATQVRVGTELRDAAVDPQPGDFLAPVNAGADGDKGNPHGPHVVSPEIHASAGLVLPGPVGDAQEARETEFATRIIAGSEDVTVVSIDMATEDAEQLKGAALDDALKAAGLSTAGKADEKRVRLATWHLATRDATDDPAPAATATEPHEPQRAVEG